MGLPFLDKDKMVGLIVAKRGKKEAEVSPEMNIGGDEGLNQAATDVLGAIERKSPSELAQALEAFFIICESKPHEENEMEGEQ